MRSRIFPCLEALSEVKTAVHVLEIHVPRLDFLVYENVEQEDVDQELHITAGLKRGQAYPRHGAGPGGLAAYPLLVQSAWHNPPAFY